MARNSKHIDFEGIFSTGVLGTFKIIRGFADLRDLAKVSVPFKMAEGDLPNQVTGHQRKLDTKHAEDIKNYLEGADNRFFPEVVLAIRYKYSTVDVEGQTVGVSTVEDGPLVLERRFSGKNHRIQKLRVLRKQLETVKSEKLIRRIDGNHRLALAEDLQEDMTLPDKYLAPFCMLLLGENDDAHDDYAESLIFHTINNTALPLESEHGLSLLLGQDPAYTMTEEKEFEYSPGLHLTRLLMTQFNGLPAPAKLRFGERPRGALWESARSLIDMEPAIAKDLQTLTSYANNLFATLADISTLLTVNHPCLCATHGFFELAARVWRDAEGDTHEQKLSWTVDYLDRIGHWLGNQGITKLLDPMSPSQQLLETFDASQLRIPTRVFLARWYPAEDAEDDAFNKARLRLQQIKQTIAALEQTHDINLKVIDMGTEAGSTFPIHAKMYEAIESSDIIICDLTGHRPNVFIEAGYALKHHEENRLVFLFQPSNDTDKIPFDLNTFKYVKISEAAEIPEKLTPEIEAILKSASALLNE